MLKKTHPAKSARTLSLGLTISSMFGMITVFSLNQNNADLQAIKDQQMLETAAKLQAQQQVAPATTTVTKTTTKPKASTTTPNDSAATTTTVAPVDAAVAPAEPAAPAVETTVVAPAAPAAPAPAPASNTTTSGSK